MNVTLLTGGSQITQDSSFLDRLSLGGSTLLLGMVIVFSVLGIIFGNKYIERRHKKEREKAENV